MEVTQLVRVRCALCGCDHSIPERGVNGFALERCRDCGFVFVNPRPSTEDTNRIYQERDAASLIELYARITTPTIRAGYRRKLALLERNLPGKGRLLDFACGAGYFTEEAHRAGWEAHGVDLGPWVQEAADARGVENIHVGFLQDLEFPDHFFDVVHAAQVFEHLETPLEVLAELRRILRPGGLLYVDVPNYRTLSILLGRDDFAHNEPPQHINYFTPRTLRRLLEAAGFEVGRVETEGGLKWENLLGKRIRSEILDAYEPAPAAPPSPPQTGSLGLRSKAKQLVLSSLIRPVFYEVLKVGMLLYGLARRPEK